MRPWSILLRVLLSLVLVLNGTASAMAATSMPMNHFAAHMPKKAPVAVSPQMASDMPCPQHHPASAAVSSHDLPNAVHPAPEKSKHPAPDCCKFGTCTCACTQLAQATFPSLNIGTIAFDGNRHVHWLTSAHTAPALPHLIRPPIG